jgi:hypothetical protein
VGLGSNKPPGYVFPPPMTGGVFTLQRRSEMP